MDVERVLALHRQGLSVRVIARELGASRSSVHRVVAAQAAAELASVAAPPQRASESQQAAAIAAIAQVGQRLLACGAREDAEELTDTLALFDESMFDDGGGLSPLFCFRLRCGYDVPPELAAVVRARLAPFADSAELTDCLDPAVARWEQLRAAVP